jgi:hypothetical protein
MTVTSSRHDGSVMHFATSSIAHQLHGIAVSLQAMSGRTDWWGSARIAFDAVIDDYCVRVESLMFDAQVGDL